MSARRKRVAILISGRGSNMGALIEAARGAYPAEIVLVVSDRSDAAGLAVAARHRITAESVERGRFASREAHETAVDRALRSVGIDLVCLAGYMRLLSPAFVDLWAGRLINIHPALLPLFPGLHTHRRALEAGLRIHGATVHFVTAQVDAGPIIAQAAVPVDPGDTSESLSARVLAAEHRLYPLALRLVAEERVRLEGGRAIFAGGFQPAPPGIAVVSPTPAAPIDFEQLARITP